MRYNLHRRQRRSIRLPGFDYSTPGAYFVTTCVHGGECLLGEVVDGKMQLSEHGRRAYDSWAEVPAHFQGVTIDSFVIMPNHVHAIIILSERGGETPPLQPDPDCRGAVSAPHPGAVARPTLGQVVAFYKYRSTFRINAQRQTPGAPFWQRNYWEHVVRSEAELQRIRSYIEANPARWHEDRLRPGAAPNPFNRWS